MIQAIQCRKSPLQKELSNIVKDENELIEIVKKFEKYDITTIEQTLWISEQLLKDEFKLKQVQAVRFQKIQQTYQKQILLSEKGGSKIKEINNMSALSFQTQLIPVQNSDKHIFIIGQMSSGKTTVVQFILNYLANTLQSNIRYQIKERKIGFINQYIISVPTFSNLYIYEIQGVCQNIDQDKKIFKEVQDMMGKIKQITLICVVLKTSDVRLSDTQTYLLGSFFNYLPKTYSANIVALITFSDGRIPQMIETLQQESCIWKQNLEFIDPWNFVLSCSSVWNNPDINTDPISQKLLSNTKQAISQLLLKILQIEQVPTSGQIELNKLQTSIEFLEKKLIQTFEQKIDNPQQIQSTLKSIEELDKMMNQAKSKVMNKNYGYDQFLGNQISICSTKDIAKLNYLNLLKTYQDSSQNNQYQYSHQNGVAQATPNTKNNYQNSNQDNGSINSYNQYSYQNEQQAVYQNRISNPQVYNTNNHASYSQSQYQAPIEQAITTNTHQGWNNSQGNNLMNQFQQSQKASQSNSYNQKSNQNTKPNQPQADSQNVDQRISGNTSRRPQIEYWALVSQQVNQNSNFDKRNYFMQEMIKSCDADYQFKRFKEFLQQQFNFSNADIIILNYDEVPEFLVEQLQQQSRFLIVTSFQDLKYWNDDNFIINNPSYDATESNRMKINKKILSLNSNFQAAIPTPNLPQQVINDERLNKNNISDNPQFIEDSKRKMVQILSNNIKSYPIQRKNIQIYLISSLKHQDIIGALKQSLIFAQQDDQLNIITTKDYTIQVNSITNDNEIKNKDSPPYGIMYTSESLSAISTYKNSSRLLRISQELDQTQLNQNDLQLKVINASGLEFKSNSYFILTEFIQRNILRQTQCYNDQLLGQDLKILFLGFNCSNELYQLAQKVQVKVQQNQGKDLQFLYKNISFKEQQDEVIQLYRAFPNQIKCLIFIPYSSPQIDQILFDLKLNNRNSVYITYSSNLESFNKQYGSDGIYLKPQQIFQVEKISQRIYDYLTKE